jgi:DNA-binding NarL/FixJ family response regulator
VTLTLAIVDDDALWIDLLRLSLERTEVDVVATFSSATRALDAWPSSIDVALIDVDLGSDSMSGFELARRLRDSDGGIAVVFLTSVLDPWLIDEAAASAIAGTSYLLKGSVGSVDQLRKVIQAAARGDVVVDDAIAESLSGGGAVPGLNALQMRILRAMATGRSNAEIAADLDIAVKTVEANITKMARHLDVPEGRNVRIGCVTHYLAHAVSGAHGAVGR